MPDTATVYALGLAAIAAIYVGFAMSDGRLNHRRRKRRRVRFAILSAAAVTGNSWLLVLGYLGHG